MKKILLLFVKITITLFIIFFICELTLCISGRQRYKHERKMNNLPNLTYKLRPYIQYSNINDLDCDIKSNNNCAGKIRLPSGLEYKNRTPITVFGCSYAHGDILLKQNQIFSHKLAEILKRPVYNRALIGADFSWMYYQATNEDFYKKVPASDTVIYIMIQDHYRRMLNYKFDPCEDFFRLNYKFDIKNKTLTKNDYDNEFYNLLKSSYTISYLYSILVKYYINNKKNADKITDVVLYYFINTRAELEKHWNNKLNFIIVFYESDEIKYSKILRKKLTDNGFKVISTKEITNSNLCDSNNMENGHPTEQVWDLLTPLIVKKAGI